jgi:hypothetical protein
MTIAPGIQQPLPQETQNQGGTVLLRDDPEEEKRRKTGTKKTGV